MAMDCKQICEELVFRYTDNELGQELIVAYQRHIEQCPHCAQKTEVARRVVMLVRQRCTRCEPPTDLRDRILERLRQG